MPLLFGVNIQQLVNQALPGSTLPAVTLQKLTPGAYNPADPTAGNSPTYQNYTAKGVTSDWKYTNTKDGQGGDLVRSLEFKLVIVLGPLPAGIVPAPEDNVIVVHPQTGDLVTAIIERDGVTTDPAGATAICMCRALPQT